MISKELLNSVLRTNIQQGDYYIKNNILSYSYCRCDNEWIVQKINIYELAFKCKEWAILNGGYNIWSSGYGKECYIDGRSFKEFENIRFFAASEPEAIFKACEWILKLKGEEK